MHLFWQCTYFGTPHYIFINTKRRHQTDSRDQRMHYLRVLISVMWTPAPFLKYFLHQSTCCRTSSLSKTARSTGLSRSPSRNSLYFFISARALYVLVGSSDRNPITRSWGVPEAFDHDRVGSPLCVCVGGTTAFSLSTPCVFLGEVVISSYRRGLHDPVTPNGPSSKHAA